VIDAFEGEKGPDVLILQEVENEAILKTLRDGLKHGSEYVTLVNLNTSPGRGIDVALLSRLPIAFGRSPRAHRVDFAPTDQAVCETTRDILEVPLALPDGTVLTVYGVHFPSNDKPMQCRDAAATELNSLVSALPADEPAIAGGDTNINCEQAQQSTISQVLQKKWVVPDEIWKGCRPPGSSFFIKRNDDDGSMQPQWSFLDFLMATPNLTVSARNGPNWFVDFGSFRTVIASPEQQVKVDGLGRATPFRFDATSAKGSSDHWPAAISLIRKP
jgi:endonuclease/exonuclease/phosphatase family metal-dependent hydrolase